MRLTARGIVINKKSGKVLLLKYVDDKSNINLGDGFWVMPGGGVEANESFEIALKREIYEETGISQIEILRCITSRIIYLDLFSKADYYYERYYLVFTDEEKLQNTNFTALEKEVIKEYKWWSIEDIKINQKNILPPKIAQVLEKDLINLDSIIDITDEELLIKVN